MQAFADQDFAERNLSGELIKCPLIGWLKFVRVLVNLPRIDLIDRIANDANHRGNVNWISTVWSDRGGFRIKCWICGRLTALPKANKSVSINQTRYSGL